MTLTVGEFVNLDEKNFRYEGPENVLSQRLSAVSIDSRTIADKALFIAIKGERLDGHGFIDEAFSNGALAAVVSRDWFESHGPHSRPLLVVRNTLESLQQAAGGFRKRFTLPVVAITGTNGKTTTKEFIASVLSNLGKVCKNEGNLNNHIGLPLTLFTLRSDYQAAVLEMGMNHFGEIARLCELAQPDYGLITNVGHGHLQFLGSLDGVAKAKAELFDYLEKEGTGFVNLDDPRVAKHAEKLTRTVTYGFAAGADVTGERLAPTQSGHPRMKSQGQEITLGLIGDHNLSNALAAIAVGLEFGIDMAQIKHSLETTRLQAKRMEFTQKGEVLVINDCYNANPDSTLAALATLAAFPAQGRRIFVLADMLELGEAAETEHQKIGEQVAQSNIDMFFTYGQHARHAAEAASAVGRIVKHFDDKASLVAELRTAIADKDVILVKGSRGMKMETILDELFQDAL